MRFVRCAAAALPVLLFPAIALAQPEPKAPPTTGTASAPAPPPAEPAPGDSAPATSGTALPPPPPAPTGAARPALVPNGPISPGMMPRTGTPITTTAADGGRDLERTRGEIGAKPSDVYAEDWWNFSRPILELHGYFRMRAELFHNFSLGRVDPAATTLWPTPADSSYQAWSSASRSATVHNASYCGGAANPGGQPCEDKTQSGANIRFRLNPELHISDNLRIMSQVDMLDNLVMGSTPEGYANTPNGGATNPTAGSTGYWRTSNSGYVPIGAYANTQVEPVAGQNSLKNSIAVKRVWGEYVTPIGQFRFGRMPDHWGLGMVHNSGDTYDSDYQSTIDRIMFTTLIKPLDLYVSGAWDFPNEGMTSASVNNQQGQPYDIAQNDDVNQYSLIIARKRNPTLQRMDLAQGDAVVNGGMYLSYRNQFLANDLVGSNTTQNLGSGNDALRDGYQRRGYSAWTPDLWLQFLYKKFRFEAEGVAVAGSVESLPNANYRNTTDPNNNGYKLRQYGFTGQAGFKAVEDRLRLNFGTGWSSGDPESGLLTAGNNGFDTHANGNKRTYKEFRFNPNYTVDLILFRHILNRVQGAYYFRPSVDYDFSRNPNGQRLGGGAAIIWSRASEFVQTPGHRRDLGVEIDLTVYYQSKDGSLNDDPDKMGGFYTMIQYGVLFPLWGLDPMPVEKTEAAAVGIPLGTGAAQTLRWYAGILF